MICMIMVTLVDNVLQCWRFASSCELGIFAVTAPILPPILVSFQACSFYEREWFMKLAINIATKGISHEICHKLLEFMNTVYLAYMHTDNLMIIYACR